jgi:hypothetical protein
MRVFDMDDSDVEESGAGKKRVQKTQEKEDGGKPRK